MSRNSALHQILANRKEMSGHLEKRATAKEKKDRKRRGPLRAYGAAMAAAAPVAAIQAISDIPEGWVEAATERATRKHLDHPMPDVRGGSLRRGLARGGGRLGAAMVTTPLFLSGMRDVKDGKTKQERRRGYAKVVGAGTAFAGLKGALEAAGEHAGTGRGADEVWKRIRNLAGARTIIGAGSGVVTAATTAAMLKKQDKDPNSLTQRLLIPGVTGAVFGAGKGAIEHAVEHGAVGFKDKALLKELAGRSAGKTAGGLFAGLVVNEIMRKFLKPKEKRANAAGAKTLIPPSAYPTSKATNPAKGVTILPGPAALYQETLDATKTLSDDALKKIYNENIASDFDSTPTRRAMHYAYYDAMKSRGLRPKDPPNGRRKLYEGPPIANSKAPLLLASAGMIFGPSALLMGMDDLNTSERSNVLRDALDRILLEKDAELDQITFTPREASHRGIDPGTSYDITSELEKERSFLAGVSHRIGEEDVQKLVKEGVLERSGETYVPSRKAVKRYGAGSPSVKFLSAIGDSQARLKQIGKSGKDARMMFMPVDVDPVIFAHEMGHAQAGKFRRATYGSNIMRELYVKTNGIAMLTGVIAVGNAATTAYNTPEEVEAKTKMLAVIGGTIGAIQAPVLLEEAHASAAGLRMFAKAGASVGELAKGAGKLAVAFSTYATAPAIPLIGAGLLARKARLAREARQEERGLAKKDSSAT